MKNKIRHRIITEKKQVAVLVNSTATINFSCEFCGVSGKMVSPLLAAKLLRISTREIYRKIELGKIHFIETEDFQLFICLNSIVQRSNVPLFPPSLNSS